MTLEVARRHKKLAPESGVEFMASISGACIQGPNVSLLVSEHMLQARRSSEFSGCVSVCLSVNQKRI